MSRRVLQYPRRQRPLQKHVMPKTANSSWRSDGVSCGGCGDTCRWPESLKEERSQKKPRQAKLPSQLAVATHTLRQDRMSPSRARARYSSSSVYT